MACDLNSVVRSFMVHAPKCLRDLDHTGCANPTSLACLLFQDYSMLQSVSVLKQAQALCSAVSTARRCGTHWNKHSLQITNTHQILQTHITNTHNKHYQSLTGGVARLSRGGCGNPSAMRQSVNSKHHVKFQCKTTEASCTLHRFCQAHTQQHTEQVYIV